MSKAMKAARVSRWNLSWFSRGLAAAFLLSPAMATPSGEPGAPAFGELLLAEPTSGGSIADVAMSPAGNFVVVWHDRRDYADVAARVVRADGIPLTGVLQVNTWTTDQQIPARVAMDEDGDFVVAWTSRHQDGASYGTFARLYDASGNARTGEIKVHETSGTWRTLYDVTMTDDGRFAAVLKSQSDLYVRAFAADGTPLGAEFRISGDTSNTETPLAMVPAADGNFLVFWVGANGVACRSFDASGQPRTGEIRVNERTSGGRNLDVAVDADGSFAVLWNSNGNPPGFRLYDSLGVPRTGELSPSPTTSGNFNAVAVEQLVGGGFVVAWNANNGAGHYRPFARIYDEAGIPVALPFQITTNGAETTHLRAQPDGGFVAVLAGYDGDPSGPGALTRVYRNDGTPATEPLLVNHNTNGDQTPKYLAMDHEGNFAIAWGSFDGNGSGVFGRLLEADGAFATSQLQLNTFEDLSQVPAFFDADADGDLLAVWGSEDRATGGTRVYTRRFAGSANLPMRVTIGESSDPVGTDGELTYVVTAHNDHPGSSDPAIGLADGVIVKAFLPIEVAFESIDAPGWDCSRSGRVVNCDHQGPIPPASSRGVAIHVTTPSGGPAIVSTASLFVDQFDDRWQDNTTTATTQLATCEPGQLRFVRSRFDVNEGRASRRIRVERTGGACGAVSVRYATQDFGALAGLDYVAKSGTLNWRDGDTVVRSFGISIIQDALPEPAERISVLLTDPTGGATVGSTSTVRILDDD